MNGVLKTLVARDLKHQDGKVGIFYNTFSETIDDCSYRPGIITYACRYYHPVIAMDSMRMDD